MKRPQKQDEQQAAIQIPEHESQEVHAAIDQPIVPDQQYKPLNPTSSDHGVTSQSIGRIPPRNKETKPKFSAIDRSSDGTEPDAFSSEPTSDPDSDEDFKLPGTSKRRSSTTVNTKKPKAKGKPGDKAVLAESSVGNAYHQNNPQPPDAVSTTIETNNVT